MRWLRERWPCSWCVPGCTALDVKTDFDPTIISAVQDVRLHRTNDLTRRNTDNSLMAAAGEHDWEELSGRGLTQAGLSRTRICWCITGWV